MQYPTSKIGVPWYTADNYLACLEIMADREILPPSYDSWAEYAEELQNAAEESGARLIKVFIDQTEFSTWCRTKRILPDAKARESFVKSVVFCE